ncbi:MAG: hypothetical protein JXJ04_18100 [Spirochaetales bacterium]|nr:hypothetical protein [Spirochaetales bacterium]
MILSNFHDFHFVMDKGMKDKIKSLDLFSKSGSLSGKIVGILNVLTPVIGKEHKWGKQRLSKYKAVCDDPGEIREHVHVYIPDEMYRKLKLLHQDLNFYSIAQLVRGLLNFFFGLVGLYKNEVFQELEKNFTRWGAEDEEIRLTPREFLRQLWKIIRFLPGKNRLVTVYSDQYAPFWIFRV